MKTQNGFYAILIIILFLISGCSDNGDVPGKEYPLLSFDKTELTVDSKSNSIEFFCEKENWVINYVREVIGSDTTAYFTTKNNINVKGYWYSAEVTNNILKVQISENEINKKRQIIFEIIKFGYVGNSIKVIQNSN